MIRKSSHWALFLSIHLVHLNRILAGTKNLELRRKRPNMEIGCSVLLYSPSPTKALFGIATVSGITSATPSELWRSSRTETALKRNEFDEYLEGVSMAHAIHLKNVRTLKTPMSLDRLRANLPGFNPPQGYLYLQISSLGFLHNQFAGRLTET